MTTELLAAAESLTVSNAQWTTKLIFENLELRKQCERARNERDELRQLIIEMRKRVAQVMHSSMDDFK